MAQKNQSVQRPHRNKSLIQFVWLTNNFHNKIQQES